MDSRLDTLASFRYPRYDELPDKLVFLDTIVRLINERHAPFPAIIRTNRKHFTSSMASNYIKQGLTPPPIGKKYNREHICLIFFASTYKLVFGAENVLALTKRLFDDNDVQTVNDALADALEASIARHVGADAPAVEHDSSLSEATWALIEAISDALAAKAAALAILDSEGADD